MPITMAIPPNARYEPMDPAQVDHLTYADESDPSAFVGRLFVGCLNMQVCVREHIIELFSFYGPLTGVTYSKSGYAFVQFARPEDAENARLNLDNYFFQAKRLDVKYATPQNKSRRNEPPVDQFEWTTRGKRGGRRERERETAKKRLLDGDPQSSVSTNEQPTTSTTGNHESPTAKGIPQSETADQSDVHTAEGQREESSGVEHERSGSTQRAANGGDNPSEVPPADPYDQQRAEGRKRRVDACLERLAVPADDEQGAVLNQEEIPDLLICGGCHLITGNLQFFYEHRLRRCDRIQPKKFEDEPSVFRCFHCEETCRNSWDLILHMSQKHKISLYRDNSQQMTVEYPTHFND